MMGRMTQKTSVQHAYDEIRHWVVTGEFEAGTKMIVRPIAERLGISATPIKSALAALERDGFLVAIPNRGYFVPHVDIDDVREIYELREALDGLAVRKAAARPDAPDFAQRVLIPIYEQQERSVAHQDIGWLRDLDIEFHQAIWRAADNERLAKFTDSLSGQIRLAWGTHRPGLFERALVEHRHILDAIAAGDPAKAEEASREHLRRALAAYGPLVSG